MSAMKITRLFTKGQDRAVRIPRSLCFPDEIKEVEVHRHGDTIILKPCRPRWSDFVDDAPAVPSDFLNGRERDQEVPQLRNDGH